MLELKNTEYNFSLYANLLSAKEPSGTLDINQLIEVIKYGYLKDIVLRLRDAKDKAIYNKIKQTELPCVTLSGIFSERNSKHLKDHSGLIQIDIDNLDNYDNLYNKLIKDDYSYVCFRSPGGQGIKIVVKINPSEETHLEQFYALEKYYKETYNVKIDGSCKDLSRCMLLSYDSDIFCNPFSKVYEELYLPKPIAEKHEASNNLTHTVYANNRDAEYIINSLLEEVEKNRIDITNSYENWIRVGFSIASCLGENGRNYFSRFSAFHLSFDSKKCDKQYTQLLKRNNGATSIGSLIYIAKQFNIALKFSKQEIITPVNIEVQNSATPSLNISDKELYERLRKLRLNITAKEGIKAFMVFGNSTLNELVYAKPKNLNQLALIKGFGQKKISWFGQEIIDTINEKAQAINLSS